MKEAKRMERWEEGGGGGDLQVKGILYLNISPLSWLTDKLKENAKYNAAFAWAFISGTSPLYGKNESKSESYNERQREK